jgi:hypothetical protein
MNEMSIKSSYSNLTQIDRVQQQKNIQPIVHQEQNANLIRSDITQRLHAPVQPDTLEEKQIDPQNEKRRKNENSKKKKPPQIGSGVRYSPVTNGRFIDYNA